MGETQGASPYPTAAAIASQSSTSKATENSVRKPSFDPIENNFSRVATSYSGTNVKEIQMPPAGVNISEDSQKTPKFITRGLPSYDCSSVFSAGGGLARHMATPT